MTCSYFKVVVVKRSKLPRKKFVFLNLLLEGNLRDRIESWLVDGASMICLSDGLQLGNSSTK